MSEDGSPSPTTQKGRATRDRIVAAAAELMYRHGVAGSSTVVELVDWFVLDIRGVDHTSAARLLPRQVTPAEIADPVETELRSFSPKDIADIVAALLAS